MVGEVIVGILPRLTPWVPPKVPRSLWERKAPRLTRQEPEAVRGVERRSHGGQAQGPRRHGLGRIWNCPVLLPEVYPQSEGDDNECGSDTEEHNDIGLLQRLS